MANSLEGARSSLLHIPVINRGVIEFLRTVNVAEIGIVDLEILQDGDFPRKDIRAIEPEIARDLVQQIVPDSAVKLVGWAGLQFLAPTVVVPNDDVTEFIISREGLNPSDLAVLPIFLGWDRKQLYSKEKMAFDREIDIKDVNYDIRTLLGLEHSRSTDWWRQVSSVVVASGGMLFAGHNQHLPSEQTPHIDGDPRMYGKRSDPNPETTAIHAEANVLAEMAKRGIATQSCEIYVTTYPCSTCAKLIAKCGLRRVYFFDGYASGDGEDVLKQYEVEVVKVNGELELPESRLRKVPYQRSF